MSLRLYHKNKGIVEKYNQPVNLHTKSGKFGHTALV